ncbi:TPA: PRTRC system ThiF family protein [Pseudomonas aeruginosa]|nr:PRTRC system ThiF family protein [Pseudomonas aeruginosa]
MTSVAKILKPIVFKQPDSWFGRSINVVVIGAGGNGSEVVDALATFHHALISLGRPGGLNITIIDDAKVREPNLVRQRFWPCDLNQFKAVALANRYNLALGVRWVGLPFRFPSESVKSAIENAHLVITAVDLPSVRAAVADLDMRLQSEAMWLDLGNGHRHGQAVFGALNKRNRNRYPCVIDLFPEIREMPDDDTKSCSAAESLKTQDCLINRTVTTAGLSVIWEVLRYGSTGKNLIVVDLETGGQSAHLFPKG